MRAWFDNDRREIDEETFHLIHLEYVDISGLSRTRQLELEAQSQHLNNRIERVKLLLWQMRTTIRELPLQVIGSFTLFQQNITAIKMYGHKLYWAGDAQEFEGMLKRIESREKRHVIELEEKQKEILSMIQTVGEAQTGIQTRRTFVQNMNLLRKEGNPINQNETTVEELALLIRAHNEEIEMQEGKNLKK